MSNPFIHLELHTDNTTASQTFYSQLFAWKFEDMPGDMPYSLIKVGEGVGGGMMAKPSPDTPTMWMPYVLVGSVEDTLSKAHSLGARIVTKLTPIPSMGAYGVFIDPQGACIGVLESNQ